MRSKFDEELNFLNIELTEMGELISERVHGAVHALKDRDIKTAKFVMDNDDDVNDYERRIEERALKLLLRQQPVACDLRFISSALKMITDMERIGDHAVDIAEIVLSMPESVHDKSFEKLGKMSEASMEMLTESLKSFVTGDLTLVDRVSRHDEIVDHFFVEVRKEVIEEIRQGVADAEYAVDAIMIAKYLERIGDHAENISEWVAFSITGVHVQK